MYDATGRRLASAPVTAAGTGTLTLRLGLYLLRAGRQTLRLVVE